MKIETGIPLPSPRDNGVMKRWMALFDEMAVGDSFAYQTSGASSMRVTIHRRRAAGKPGVFATRKQEVGYRVWRIE